jgi:hypothetical protein
VKTILIVGSVMALVALFYLLPRRRHSVEETDAMMSRMKGGRFNPLMRFLEGDHFNADPEFWTVSGGLRGVFTRQRDMLLLARVLQIQVQSKRMSPEQAKEVYRLGAAQFWYSIVAVPEALVCRLFRRIPHVNAHAALQFHFEATLRSINFYLDSSDSKTARPQCLFL